MLRTYDRSKDRSPKKTLWQGRQLVHSVRHKPSISRLRKKPNDGSLLYFYRESRLLRRKPRKYPNKIHTLHRD